ncbi:MAG: SRPBCC domain-containing protein [Chitinophagaceae bacterium]
MQKELLGLEVEKEFPVQVQELSNAWTNPEKLKQWWKPSGHQLTDVNIDLREGGKFNYVFQGTNAETALVISGEYQEVNENRKLVYSWNWEIPNTEAISNNEFMLTVEFIPAKDHSKLRVVQHNFKDNESIHPHKKGWEIALDDLYQFLSEA